MSGLVLYAVVHKDPEDPSVWKLYVGTTGDFQSRQLEHQRTYGHLGMVYVHRIKNNANCADENTLTQALALQFGSGNVRGGVYCQTKSRSLIDYVNSCFDACYKCGTVGCLSRNRKPAPDQQEEYDRKIKHRAEKLQKISKDTLENCIKKMQNKYAICTLLKEFRGHYSPDTKSRLEESKMTEVFSFLQNIKEDGRKTEGFERTIKPQTLSVLAGILEVTMDSEPEKAFQQKWVPTGNDFQGGYQKPYNSSGYNSFNSPYRYNNGYSGYYRGYRTYY